MYLQSMQTDVTLAQSLLTVARSLCELNLATELDLIIIFQISNLSVAAHLGIWDFFQTCHSLTQVDLFYGCVRDKIVGRLIQVILT